MENDPLTLFMCQNTYSSACTGQCYYLLSSTVCMLPKGKNTVVWVPMTKISQAKTKTGRGTQLTLNFASKSRILLSWTHRKPLGKFCSSIFNFAAVFQFILHIMKGELCIYCVLLSTMLPQWQYCINLKDSLLSHDIRFKHTQSDPTLA